MEPSIIVLVLLLVEEVGGGVELTSTEERFFQGVLRAIAHDILLIWWYIYGVYVEGPLIWTDLRLLC